MSSDAAGHKAGTEYNERAGPMWACVVGLCASGRSLDPCFYIALQPYWFFVFDV
jgi:hypothetical protein